MYFDHTLVNTSARSADQKKYIYFVNSLCDRTILSGACKNFRWLLCVTTMRPLVERPQQFCIRIRVRKHLTAIYLKCAFYYWYASQIQHISSVLFHSSVLFCRLLSSQQRLLSHSNGHNLYVEIVYFGSSFSLTFRMKVSLVQRCLHFDQFLG